MTPTPTDLRRTRHRVRRHVAAALALLLVTTGCDAVTQGDALSGGERALPATSSSIHERSGSSSTSSSSSSSSSSTSTSSTTETTVVDPSTTAAQGSTGAPTTAPRSTTKSPPKPAPTTAAPPPTATPAPPPPAMPAPAPAGWTLVFGDEFDGGSLDTAKWSVCGNCTTNLGERVDDPGGRSSQAGVSDGSLWMQARGGGGSWTSSPWVWSEKKYTFRHGKVEIRAKMPKGTGVWPALWMLPAQSAWPPEIDIYESIDNESRYFVNYHYGSSGNPQQFDGDSPVPINNIDVTQWHTYGVEWYPGLLVFTLDGAEVARATQGIGQIDAAAPMYLIMNVALGGNWASEPDGSTPGTAEMRVDWVHVYQQ
jgi:hypothetical protein